MFEQLIQNISDSHGTTHYVEGGGGKAIKPTLRFPHNRRDRNHFYIYNMASYGTRTTRAPRTLGPSMRDFQTHEEDGPSLSWRARWHRVTPQRTLPPSNLARTVRDRYGHPVIQVCRTALFLLFDIERTLTPDPETLLQQIYETFVLSLYTPVGDTMRVFQDGIQRTPPGETRTGDPPGRGRSWDYGSFPRLIVPEVSQTEQALATFMDVRSRAIKDKIEEEHRRLRDKQSEYNSQLRRLHESKNSLFAQEDLVLALQRDIREPDESPELVALSQAIEFMYDKVWLDGGVVYALTKPIVMEYGTGRGGSNDPYRAMAGRFIVKVDSSGGVDYWREDRRQAKVGNSLYSGPHHSSGICWGTYRTLVAECQAKGEFAQLFMLVAQHIKVVNGSDCYIQLREYAENLSLEVTEDPLLDLLAEPEPVAESIPVIAEVSLVDSIEEVDSLSEEDLEALGVNLPVHLDHEDSELNNEIEELEDE